MAGDTDESAQVQGLLKEIERLRAQRNELREQLSTITETHTALEKEHKALSKRSAALEAGADELAEMTKRAESAEASLASYRDESGAHMAMLESGVARIDDADVRSFVLSKYRSAVESSGDKAPAFADWYGEFAAESKVVAPFRVEAPAAPAAPAAAAPEAPAAPAAPAKPGPEIQVNVPTVQVPRDTSRVAAPVPGPNGHSHAETWQAAQADPAAFAKKFGITLHGRLSK